MMGDDIWKETQEQKKNNVSISANSIILNYRLPKVKTQTNFEIKEKFYSRDVGRHRRLKTNFNIQIIQLSTQHKWVISFERDKKESINPIRYCSVVFSRLLLSITFSCYRGSQFKNWRKRNMRHTYKRHLVEVKKNILWVLLHSNEAIT